MKIIAGPCAIESIDHFVDVTGQIAERFRKVRPLGASLVLKGSFDKANRTSASSKRGVGIRDGLLALEQAKKVLGYPVTTDVHETWQIPDVASVVDVIQIPAMLSRQTDLVCGAAVWRKTVNVKFPTTGGKDTAEGILSKVAPAPERWLTYRGTHFSPEALVVDLARVAQLQKVLFDQLFVDVTHTNGGNSGMSFALTRALKGFGVRNFFMEVHDRPDRAHCDGKHQLDLDLFEAILRCL